MPLSFLGIDEQGIIKKVKGNLEIRHHLENLGFVSGSKVKVIQRTNGNYIVSIKETRVALSEELARRIIV